MPPPRFRARFRSRSCDRKCRSEASRKERKRPFSGSTSARKSFSTSSAKKPLSEVPGLVRTGALMADVGVERLPVGLAEAFQGRPSFGVGTVSGGEHLAPLRRGHLAAHAPLPEERPKPQTTGPRQQGRQVKAFASSDPFIVQKRPFRCRIGGSGGAFWFSGFACDLLVPIRLLLVGLPIKGELGKREGDKATGSHLLPGPKDLRAAEAWKSSPVKPFARINAGWKCLLSTEAAIHPVRRFVSAQTVFGFEWPLSI